MIACGRSVTGMLLLLITLTVCAAPADEKLAGARLNQHPGAAIDPALRFTDETGRAVQIGDYFDGRPLLLALVYYHCPNLCGVVLKGLARGVGALDLQGQRDFQVIAVSIDPQERPAQARTARSELFTDNNPAAARRCCCWPG
jgi:protein SCO1/2